MTAPTADFLAILERLTESSSEFIVVGGVCGVLHGAPVTTFDLDIVHRREPGNLERLVSALDRMHAIYRAQGSRRISPNALLLATPGHHLLMTDHGPLDLLGVIGHGRSYDDLLVDSVEMRVASLTVRVLGLEALIAVKEETDREKDRLALPLLRRTLDERGRA